MCQPSRILAFAPAFFVPVLVNEAIHIILGQSQLARLFLPPLKQLLPAFIIEMLGKQILREFVPGEHARLPLRLAGAAMAQAEVVTDYRHTQAKRKKSSRAAADRIDIAKALAVLIAFDFSMSKHLSHEDLAKNKRTAVYSIERKINSCLKGKSVV